MKNHKDLLENIVFVNKDKNLKDQGLFDVIHFGGAVEKVPEELTKQLAKGGRMWIPLWNNQVKLYDKDLSGKVTSMTAYRITYHSLSQEIFPEKKVKEEVKDSKEEQKKPEDLKEKLN